MTSTDCLSERERAALEHLQKAAELGSTLAECCTAFGVEVKELYAAKQQLVKKGMLPGKSPPESPERRGSAFVPVHIVPSTPTPSGLACRLVHPSGWVVECGTFPPVAWMTALFAGEAHAAS